MASTNENSIILDPFNGSGTTGIASHIVGNRTYIGIETNIEYLDLTIKRYHELNKNINMFTNVDNKGGG